MARPSKLTPKLRAAICKTIAKGNFKEVAAQYHGIGSSTLYAWIKRGKEEEEGPYREFADAIARAEAQAIVELTAIVKLRSSEKMGGAHAQWMLEKLDRKRYGRDANPHAGDASGETRIVISRATVPGSKTEDEIE